MICYPVYRNNLVFKSGTQRLKKRQTCLKERYCNTTINIYKRHTPDLAIKEPLAIFSDDGALEKGEYPEFQEGEIGHLR